MSRRIVLALDLLDDAALIADYEAWHRLGGPPSAVLQSIRDAGIDDMEIYRAGSRMVMIMDVADDFAMTEKARADAANPDVVAWEKRMKQFQRPIPAAGPDGHWFEMARIFSLATQIAASD